MIIVHTKPAAALQPYIDRYWSWQGPEKTEQRLPLLVAGTGVELYFHFGRPFIFIGEGSPPLTASNSHLLCVRQVPRKLKPLRNIGFLCVRFRAGMFRHFCNIPMADLNDTLPDPESLWGRDGSKLAGKVLEAPTLKKKILAVESGLINLLQACRKDEDGLDYALNKIYSQYRTIRIADIARELNLSRRHFQRGFSRSMGVSPKAFHRNTRFQQTLKKLMLNGQRDYLPGALDAGYYDQSHFIKDFQHFTKTTPSFFLCKDNFMSHFYNTTL